jgi:hypothetical protein
MCSPQSFLVFFRQRLHKANIRFALTSGQACVHYGIQQTTKDSDWIVEPRDLGKLVALLVELDSSLGMSVSYRAICGAPCSADYLGNGWTTHVRITDADSTDHHLDFFGQAPRVTVLECDPLDSDIASRVLVAQMKKTDREKDWPFVAALGKQAIVQGDARGILHGQDVNWLIQTWNGIEPKLRVELASDRPLLQFIDDQPTKLRRAVMIEKFIWQVVNRSRYRVYQQAWKEFFRQWRREPGFQWPIEASFEVQCNLLADAAAKYKLPRAPLDLAAKERAMTNALQEASDVFAATTGELEQIAPPLRVLLP